MVANLTSAIVFYLLASENIKLGQMSFLGGTLFQMIFFALSELLPILSFVQVNTKFVEVLTEEREAAGPNPRQNVAPEVGADVNENEQRLI